MRNMTCIILLSLALSGCASSAALEQQRLEAERFQSDAQQCRDAAIKTDQRINTLIDSNASLITRADGLEQKVAMLDETVKECEFRIREREDEFADQGESIADERAGLESLRSELAPALEGMAKQQELARASSVMADDLGAVLGAAIKDGLIEVRADGARVLVSVKNSLLYSSLNARLSTKGKDVLNIIAGSLNRLGFNMLDARSYADSVQPGGELKKQFPTNWHLTSYRAASVVDYLASMGVDSGRMTASGMSDNSPLADNATRQGRKANRRLVLIITP